MIPTLLLSLLGILVSSQGGHCLVPPNELQKMSEKGSRYIDGELENAISGVRQMKLLMEQTSNDHQEILNSLEDTKKKKEEAILLAKDMEKQLNEQEVCNDTMLALWEECKPCLKQTCMKFYTRTCHSGAGLVGRQLEEFLNHSSPFSIWVNGERIDSLMDVDEEQGRKLDDLEERYGLVEDGVDDLFQESSQAYGQLSSFFQWPFSGFQDGFHSIRIPFTRSRVARNTRPFSQFFGNYRPHQGFYQIFQPFYEMSQHFFEGAQSAMDWDHPGLGGIPEFSFDHIPTATPGHNDNRMVCREIRRNSAGCLKMKEKCDKCQAILAVDCSQTDPGQRKMKERFEDALRLAERFTRRYDEILKAFQEEMLNTTAILDQLNRQFGWVSQLANRTRNDRLLKVIMVKSSSPEDTSQTPGTQVTVQLFDSEPFSLTVPGSVPLDDDTFMDIVARDALRDFKDNKVE
ncbi:clusterin [Ahaetulla prasina]|uniref:clusterin n=1 Tax=Ahaetulla prasina TaxID=499056 RepID=UPI0026495524|nr:clusterin [Ahaetulla prasina]XP_058020715.1 clusterin [Ahaetulla prasina]XP_058020716.1 clusterin [Ahaetulla prasina]